MVFGQFRYKYPSRNIEGHSRGVGWLKKRRNQLELILYLYEYGISPSDALQLAEFEDFNWFIQELDKRKQRVDIKNKLDMLEVLAISEGLDSKKGFDHYKKYNRKMLRAYNDLGKKETFFEALKRMHKVTVFDKLKEKKNGV